MTPAAYAVIQHGEIVALYHQGTAAAQVAEAIGAQLAPLSLGGQEVREALQAAMQDLLVCQINAIKAARYDRKWEGVSEATQPTIDRARAALNGSGGQL